MEQKTFDAKLRELRSQWDWLMKCLECCDAMTEDQLEQLYRQIGQKREEALSELQQQVCHSRSPIARDLAKAQLEYTERAERVLRETGERLPAQDAEERSALLAEFAADFAGQNISYAAQAVLRTLWLQKRTRPLGSENA